MEVRSRDLINARAAIVQVNSTAYCVVQYLMLSVAAIVSALLPFLSCARVPSLIAKAADVTSAEERIELSPFEVASDQNVGSRATNSRPGGRLNSSLKDMAASRARSPLVRTVLGTTAVIHVYGPSS